MGRETRRPGTARCRGACGTACRAFARDGLGMQRKVICVCIRIFIIVSSRPLLRVAATADKGRVEGCGDWFRGCGSVVRWDRTGVRVEPTDRPCIVNQKRLSFSVRMQLSISITEGNVWPSNHVKANGVIFVFVVVAIMPF